MNRVKITIKTDNGETLCKLGTSIEHKEEYSDKDLIKLLEYMIAVLKNHQRNDTRKN